jgi:hypothetical protein
MVRSVPACERAEQPAPLAEGLPDGCPVVGDTQMCCRPARLPPWLDSPVFVAGRRHIAVAVNKRPKKGQIGEKDRGQMSEKPRSSARLPAGLRPGLTRNDSGGCRELFYVSPFSLIRRLTCHLRQTDENLPARGREWLRRDGQVSSRTVTAGRGTHARAGSAVRRGSPQG